VQANIVLEDMHIFNNGLESFKLHDQVIESMQPNRVVTKNLQVLSGRFLDFPELH